MKQEQYDQLNIDQIVKYKLEVRELFNKYAALFSFDGSFGSTNVLEHEIVLKPGARPVKQKNRKLPEPHKEFVAGEVRKLLEMDLIFETDLDWVSPLVIVPKKGGKLRMCIDYRRLNESTIKIKYPSPLIYEDIIDQLKEDRAQHFAALDLTSGYW